MKHKYLVLAVVLLTFISQANTQGIGIGTTTPDPAAMLDITSTNKGMLIPRVALTGTTDVTTIPTPPASLMVYNTATAGSGSTAVAPGFYYYDGTNWVTFLSYTLQQNINTNGKFLSGDGTDNGILMSDNGIMVVKGVFAGGPNLTEAGAGAKMIWYPKKGAIRVGYIENVAWTQASMGDHSAAFGHDVVASGPGSSAFGVLSVASGATSFAAGTNASATGTGSVAFGNGTLSSGLSAMAFGEGSTASGDYSTAMGVAALASGANSTALGFQSSASGLYSAALGYFAIASGDNSFAFGNRVSTDLQSGSFIIGDNSTLTATSSSTSDEMTMRFANGYRLFTQNEDIGTFLSTDGALVSKGFFGSGDPIAEAGEGSKMIWYPRKSAFRAGYVVSDGWNDANIGDNSTAFGFDAIASGGGASAFGNGSIASGANAFAAGSVATASGSGSISMGNSTLASGNFAAAFGENTQATGDHSFATGFGTFAFGLNSTALGNTTTAGGDYSTALGYQTSAAGLYGTSAGYNTTASADNSTALGNWVSTGIFAGSFAIGDNSTTTATVSAATDQMTMRFANGYRLFSNAAATIGVKVDPGANAWSTLSDVHMKENFAPIDGEEFLSRIGSIPIATTWNYKGQDPKQYRHYGPMAQDFYRVFGKDRFGTIGNDTAINQADFDGVNFTAIQALESRTRKLQKENEQQLQKIGKLENDIELLRQELRQIKEVLPVKK
jgi:hypothetical protein